MMGALQDDYNNIDRVITEPCCCAGLRIAVRYAPSRCHDDDNCAFTPARFHSSALNFRSGVRCAKYTMLVLSFEMNITGTQNSHSAHLII